MASYRIEFKRSAAQELADSLFPRQSIKLSGAEQLHRLRVGVYRTIYEVDPDGAVITVHYIRHSERRTVDSNPVTIRDRDTMWQTRVSIEGLVDTLKERLNTSS